MTEDVRPAFYALRSGGWRDYVTLLHLPYTLWNVAYVALGASLAPVFHTNRMLWTMAAFALALGVAAHALDELNGRPLQTRIPGWTLWTLAVCSFVDATPETLATIAGILERHASVQYRSMDDIRGSLGMNEGSAPLNRRGRDVAARPAFRTS